jgi:hypothetical protein
MGSPWNPKDTLGVLAMFGTLAGWEDYFATKIQGRERSKGDSHAPLLPVVPDRVIWDAFLVSVCGGWRDWKGQLSECPSCLLMLYCGLAFYEYDENRFWPQFAKVVGSEELPANQQSEINTVFATAARQFGLELKLRDKGTDFVGSAVNLIGIPLSLWDAFLEVCDWALWHKDWRTLSDEEWEDVVERRSGSRTRLRRFLTENRESASGFIQDLLDVREILSGDPKLTIGDIARASILRQEYFDDVPETADFLRPQDPDSLFRFRVRLIWDEQRQNISLLLPAMSRDKLPASWCVGSHQQEAAPSPDDLVLNSDSFAAMLAVTLQLGKERETQYVRGIHNWALFDLENGGRLVNVSRDQLPLRSYALISQCEIELVSRDGFDDSENQANERFELKDGTVCFLTRLWPTGKHAELCLKINGRDSRTIRFKTRARIEARFITGWGSKTAYFNRTPDGKIKIDHLPIPCVAIPSGYFKDDSAALASEFKVFIDGKAASGRWEHVDVRDSPDRNCYRWMWNKMIWLEHRPGVTTLRSLSQLDDAFKSPDLRGDRRISIEAKPHISDEMEVRMVGREGEAINRCWVNLPGAFVPMFLLCQSTEGLKWEDLLLAKDVIAPSLRFSPYILRKYEHLGVAVQRGRRWMIRESRAESIPLAGASFQLNYCGDPSILWGLYRRMICDIPGERLPMIEVIDRRGEAAYLKMTWPSQSRETIEHYLQRNGVAVGGSLWIH